MSRTMKIDNRLKILFVFSYIPFIIGKTLRFSPAVDKDQGATDGDLFVKRIIHGESKCLLLFKADPHTDVNNFHLIIIASCQMFVYLSIYILEISDKPEMLMFTAPYRLCEGECDEDKKNFVMSFPLFLGKRAKTEYKKRYHRDFKKIHLMGPNAPFKQKTTRAARQLLKSHKCPFVSPSTQIPAVEDNEPTTCLHKDYCDPQFLISNCPNIKKRICHGTTSQGTTSTVPPFFEGKRKDPIKEIQKNLRTADNLLKSMMRRRKTITFKSYRIEGKKESTVSDFVDNDNYLYDNIDNHYEHPVLYRTYKTLGPYKPTKGILAYNY